MSLTSVNKLENNTVELQIQVSEEQFQDALVKAYKKKVKSIALPGFRKGKAPKAMIEKMYGKEFFYDDAINMVYPAAYEAAVEEAKIEPVDRANVSDLQVEDGKGFSFKATVTVKPEVTVKNYKGIKAEKTVETIMAADVNAELDRMRERNSRLTNVERAAKNGDTALIDFEGFKDGVAFEGGKGENFPLVLGSGQFIPGFEEQVVGHKEGDEFEVNVTFPTEYHAAELAGKPAMFKVTVKEIKVKELPALDDEFASEVSEFDTLDEYKQDIEKKLQERKEKAAASQNEDRVVAKVVENASMEIPEKMIDAQVDNMLRETAQRMQSQGLSMDLYMKYTGMTADQMKDQMRPEAVKRIQTRLVLEAVVKAENIETSEEKLDEEIAKMAEAYKMEADKLKSYMTDSDKDQMKQDLAVQAAVDLLVSEAKLV